MVTRPRTSSLLHEFTSKEGKPVHLWTTFSKDQVDLNFKNTKVLIHILDLLMFYVSQGASMLRLDAIGFMWKEHGTSCIHLPKTHLLIQLMRAVLEKRTSETLLITETNVPHEENISYFGNGHNEAKMVYNFTLPPLLAYSILSGDGSKLTKWARGLTLPSDQVCFFNFTASHDGVGLRPVQGILTDSELGVLTSATERNGGFISYKSNPDGSQSPYELNCNYFSLLQSEEIHPSLNIARMILSQAIMLTMPGLPAFYFHSLVGSGNDRAGAEASGRSRSIDRQKMSCDTLEKELNNAESIWAVILEELKRPIAVKQKYAAFHPYRSFEFLDNGSQFLVIKRNSVNKDQVVLCVFNLTGQDKSYDSTPKNVLDLLTGNEASAIIPAYGFRWLKL